MSILKSLGITATVSARARQSAESEGKFTKEALHDAADRQKVAAYMREHSAPWLRAWYILSLETGWRTADVCRLTWNDIDLDTGTATIVVAKQTKAAQSRAARAVVLRYIEQDKQAAIMRGDIPAWQRLTRIAPDQYVQASPDGDMLAEVQQAANDAPPKIDRKQLSPQLVAELQRMKQGSPFEFVFDRRIIGSNRAAGIRPGENEHVSRQAVWRLMRDVFMTALQVVPVVTKVVRAGRELLVRVMRYSAYSSRKTSLSLVATGAGKIDLAAAAAFIGHVDTKVTERYVLPGMKQAIPAATLADFW
ncbi:tyrosine-type recombinase/integrase [Pantoea vagans]|uniref:tyrosine-type recombinase/integrase n=1 Tax=Pantoea vagans TaxID=470934 RepID=UPI002896DAE5|nr:tyrosine-type recombinase/integrase [Pantoea vagans]